MISGVKRPVEGMYSQAEALSPKRREVDKGQSMDVNQ